MQPRKYKRYPIEVPVIFSWKDAQGIREKHVGLIREASIKGAFVLAMTPPPLGANIKFKAFRLPVGQTLATQMFGKGQVVRLKPAHGSLLGGFVVAAGRIVFRKWAKD